MKNYILYFLILIILSFIIKFIDKISNSSYLENFIEKFYSPIGRRYTINPNNVDPYYQPLFKNWFFRRGYFYPTN